MVVLRAAIEHGWTSTAAEGRGNGLSQMVDLTRRIPGSSVEFTSLNASIRCVDGVPSAVSIPPQRFGGTLVRWSVPFREMGGASA